MNRLQDNGNTSIEEKITTARILYSSESIPVINTLVSTLLADPDRHFIIKGLKKQRHVLGNILAAYNFLFNHPEDVDSALKEIRRAQRLAPYDSYLITFKNQVGPYDT